MGFGRRIGDRLRVSGSGARRSLIVLVVLAVLAASGSAVALTGPILVHRLGLSQTDETVLPSSPLPMLQPLQGDAPRPTAAGVAAVLDGAAEALPGKFTGIVVDPATGQTIWQHTPEVTLTPGSTGKLLTAAAALLTFNPTDRFVTRVVQGPQPGTVVLVGGGDPTLTTLPPGQESVYPDAPRMSDLAAAVKKAVPGPITQVLVDTSRYQGPTMAEGWDPADVAAGFITPIEPLMVDGGRINPKLTEGPRVPDPAMAAGRALAQDLGVDSSDVAEGTAAAGAKSVAAVRSAPVAVLVEQMLRDSDNVLAEIFSREIAIARHGAPTFAGGVQQTAAALAQAGFDPTGAVMHDGSGLSTEDLVPARLLGQLLSAAAAPAIGPDDTEFLRPIITGLPVAGADGTLAGRFGRTGVSGPGRGVVRAKTGTLTAVASLAGVVSDTDGRLLVFVLMSNGVSPATMRPKLDAMAAQLSRCGCR
ncbi:D-alanyl-D-alanine carboxypeptidase/D-alanyl-D-alanine endopeptidase [Pseudonocardia sp. CA-142604]|uniref:D-alanyl-D-alanine carboxypeptidase/D-alanyl-D-alanine endopeptidase n=1 Tax=Pseudonocardia sp. CA-142604 TaxID=3240024 RepID=UPI003D937D71